MYRKLHTNRACVSYGWGNAGSEERGLEGRERGEGEEEEEEEEEEVGEPR